MRRQVPPKRRFLQEPHGVTTQKTPFFIVTVVKTSNLTTIKVLGESFSTPSVSRLLKEPIVRCDICKWRQCDNQRGHEAVTWEFELSKSLETVTRE
jgi:hypothetical protein